MSTGAQSGAAAQPPGLTDKAKSLASELAQSARDKTLGAIEERKAGAAEQAEAVAHLLEDVAGDIEQQIPLVAPYLRDAASRVHRVSSTLRERDIDEFFREVGDFARRRPAFVIGACLAGGFALARFLKSSADRYDAASRRSSRAPASPGLNEEPKAALGGSASPAAGMASLSEATSPRPGAEGSAAPGGTSAAGGGSEAPDQDTAGRM